MLSSWLSSSTPPLVTWRLPKADRSSVCGRQRFSGDAAVAEQVDAWRVKEHHRRAGAAQSKHRRMRARRHRSPLVACAWRVFGITGEVVAPKEHLPPLQLPLPLRMYSMYGHAVVTIVFFSTGGCTGGSGGFGGWHVSVGASSSPHIAFFSC